MAKVTTKLQVTVPKAIADEYRIRPGDEVLWVKAGDAVRMVPARASPTPRSIESKLALFDAATTRQKSREKRGKRVPARPRGRGWIREELYRRGRAR
jgi:AbrB family looped-hinge helix DNA binding protein